MHRSFDTVDSHQTPAATTTHHCGRRPQALRRQVALTVSPHRPTSYTPPTGGIQPDSKGPGFQSPWHASAAPHRQRNFATGNDRPTDGGGFSCVDRVGSPQSRGSVTTFSAAVSAPFSAAVARPAWARVGFRSAAWVPTHGGNWRFSAANCPPLGSRTVLPVFPFPWLRGFPTTAHVRFESSGRCRRCQGTGREGRHPRAYRPRRTPR